MEGIFYLTDTIYHKSITKTLQQGAILGFILSILFITMIGVISGEWFILPVLTATIGGTIGGVIFHFLVQKWEFGNWQKLILTIIGITTFLVVFWISLVLGFALIGQWD